jgi:hypothetical protein
MDERSGQVDELTLEAGAPPRSRRPRVLWAVLAVVGVAAGALVVTSGGDDGSSRPGLPVALGSSSASVEGAAADSRLAWVAYVADDDLPALGGEAAAYRLPSTVTEADVRALGEALGVEGEIAHEGPGWSVSGEGGALDVLEGGGAPWWFGSTTMGGPVGSVSAGSGSAGCAGGPDCTTTVVDCGSVEGDAECADDAPATTMACGPGADCVEPAPPAVGDCAVHADGFDPCAVDPPVPPADLPSEADARAIALDLLAATGVDVDGAQVVVEGPYEAWYVTVEPRLDGVPSGQQSSVTVGAGGTVTFASGHLAEPERLGDYPVLDTRATIARANEQQGSAGVPAGGAAAVEDIVTREVAPAAGDDQSAPTTTVPLCTPQADGAEICETVPGVTCLQVAAPGDEPLGAPESIECTPPPEPVSGPVEVVLVDAEPSLVLLGAVDGSTDAYLVPGYRFTAEDGATVDLPAVADSELTSPPTTDTSAPDPAPAPVEPQPCEVLVEGDASGTTHTVQPDPTCVAPEPQILEEGQEPALGVGYYVDVDTECGSGSFLFAGQVWATSDTDTSSWTDERHEGGTLTLDAPDHGTFVGDAGGAKVAEFRPLGPAEDLFCVPEPRRPGG